MATVAITQILPLEADGAWLISGTIDGAPHLMRWDKVFSPTEVTPTQLSQSFMDDWARMDQLVVNKIASRTVNISHPRAVAPIAVVFGNKAACYSQVGYDQVQILAQVGGTNYRCMVRQRDLVEWAYATGNVADILAKNIANDYVRAGSWLGAFTGSFSNVSSTTSSSTTTTTTTTTTSDRRLKVNLRPLASLFGLTVYAFEFAGAPGRHVGLMAQEVYEKYPEAVIVGGEDPAERPWQICYDRLFEILGRRRSSTLTAWMTKQILAT